MSLLTCFNCGADLSAEPLPISRHATCEKCFHELRCCRMCVHYDKNNVTRCFEDRAETPIEKEVANFCEFYSPATGRGGNEDNAANNTDTARQKLDDLFG